MGRVKTRLAGAIGAVEATRFYRIALSRLVRRLADPRWETVLAVTPERALQDWPWPSGCRLVAQGPGDLGQRMQRRFDLEPPGPVVIVGSDIPAIARRQVAEAFAALGQQDAAIGPAPDGGYWLIGLRRRPRVPRPFTGVRWSSPHTLADTLANLAGCSVTRLATLEDVDDVAAWRRWRQGGDQTLG